MELLHGPWTNSGLTSPGSRPGRFHIGFYGIRNGGSRPTNKKGLAVEGSTTTSGSLAQRQCSSLEERESLPMLFNCVSLYGRH